MPINLIGIVADVVHDLTIQEGNVSAHQPFAACESDLDHVQGGGHFHLGGELLCVSGPARA